MSFFALLRKLSSACRLVHLYAVQVALTEIRPGLMLEGE